MSRKSHRARAWVQARCDHAVAWARVEHTAAKGLRRKVAGAVLENADMMAKGRSFSQVYKVHRSPVVHDDGQEGFIEHDVLMPRVSRVLALLLAIFALGSFASVFGYAATVIGAAVFGGIALTAHLIGHHELAFTSRRMAALMLLATVPVAGCAISAMCLAAELNGFLPPRATT